MATALKERPRVEAMPAVDVEAFLRDLGEIGRKHGLGLTGSMTLFVMEPEDFGLSYLADDESAVTLG